ncbi:hypothetical protein MRX96_054476 [Rhipicephalus microplus]
MEASLCARFECLLVASIGCSDIAGIRWRLAEASGATPILPVLVFTFSVISLAKGLKISPKSCENAIGERGTCMFVWECIKLDGKHLGTCTDGFLYGSCCEYDDSENSVAASKAASQASAAREANTGQARRERELQHCCRPQLSAEKLYAHLSDAHVANAYDDQEALNADDKKDVQTFDEAQHGALVYEETRGNDHYNICIQQHSYGGQCGGHGHPVAADVPASRHHDLLVAVQTTTDPGAHHHVPARPPASDEATHDDPGDYFENDHDHYEYDQEAGPTSESTAATAAATAATRHAWHTRQANDNAEAARHVGGSEW